MSYNKGRKRNFRLTETPQARRKWALLAGILIASVSLPVTAGADQRSVIRQATEQAIKAQLARVAEAQQWPDYQLQLDSWIPASAEHLPACPQPLGIVGRDSQRLPIGQLKRLVSCESDTVNWRLNVSVKAAIKLPVLVAARGLNRGERLNAGDIRSETRTLQRAETFFARPDQVAGMEVQRRIRPGQMLQSDWLGKPALIEKGNQVVIIAAKDGFAATTKGVALEQGRRGEQIEVQNLTSHKVIRAVVTGLNQVHTQF